MTRLTSYLDILTNVNATIILLGNFILPSIYWSNPLLSQSVLNLSIYSWTSYNATQCINSSLISLDLIQTTQKKKRVSIWPLQTTFLQFQICLLPITSAPVITILSFKIVTSIQTYSIQTSRYDFTNGDWSAINNQQFCIDWQTAVAACPDVPVQFELRNDKLTATIHLFISVKTH